MIEKYMIPASYTVRDTIEIMNKNLVKAVLIVDENKTVLGMFSNGDMRSYFLKGGELSSNITVAMNPDPVLYRDIAHIEEERKRQKRVLYPIVNERRQLVQVVDYNNDSVETVLCDTLKDVPLVIMAGGKGTRLYPYTKILPKPLIPLGDMTITERIIASFQKYGCQKVYMILNHKASIIKAYMTDNPHDYELGFAQEHEFLGTAGGIRLLKDVLTGTFILSNCDILLDADMECAYRTHKKMGNQMTIICAMKDFVIPYGVIETTEGGKVTEIVEKPDYAMLVNTGVYVLEPEVFEQIQENEFINMPDLADRLMTSGGQVGVFPIPEKSWMDIGQFSEMENTMRNLGLNG